MKIKGLQIDIAIAERGLTRAEFCKIVDIKEQTLARAIKTCSTTVLTAVKIAKGLKTDVMDIIAEE
jgi:predicted transcriptional regulator